MPCLSVEMGNYPNGVCLSQCSRTGHDCDRGSDLVALLAKERETGDFVSDKIVREMLRTAGSWSRVANYVELDRRRLLLALQNHNDNVSLSISYKAEQQLTLPYIQG